MKKSLLLLYGLMLLTRMPFAQEFMINEVMTANASAVLDDYHYNFSEWVEIYNPSSEGRNIEGYYLSKDPGNLTMWRIPDTYIYGKDYIIIWFDKQDHDNHANFNLRSSREMLLLSNAGGTIIDSVRIEFPFINCSYGRSPDGSSDWKWFTLPTKGAANENGITGTQVTEPEFSLKGGRYTGTQNITLSSPDGNTIYYTTDGSEPRESSILYESPVSITSTTPLKAKSFSLLHIPSKTVVNTYFIDEHEFTLPVVSISINSAFLWDDMIGIYTDGTNGIISPHTTEPKNYNQDWERYACFEYFKPNGSRIISAGAGIKIAGAASRDRGQKSLGVAFRDKYGKDNIHYPLFLSKSADRFESIMLRNSGNDYNRTLFHDAMMHSLVIGEMDVDYNAYTPSVLYLNGQYWGILNIRERVNEGYVYSNYGLDEDSIDMLDYDQIVVAGDNEDYGELVDFINNNSLAEHSNYLHIKDLVDINEYTNYLIAEIYSGNTDWPGNNLKYWKPRKDGGKWRWILYDLDFGFGLRDSYDHNTLAFALEPDADSWPNPQWATLLFRKLIENDEFKSAFIDKFNIYIYSIYNPDRVNRIIDSLKQGIEAEVSYHFQMWGSSLEDWESYINIAREYAGQRTTYMMNYLQDYFSLEDPYSLKVSSSMHQRNFVSMNDIVIHDTLFDGSYFGYRPVRIKAISDNSYRFKQWKLKYSDGRNDEIRTQSELEISLSSGIECIAEFEKVNSIANLYINEICSKNTQVPDEEFEFDDWIELYNSGEDTINLAGLFLTNDLRELSLFRLSEKASPQTLIPPHSFKLLWADGQLKQGLLHLDFKLDKDGGEVGITQNTNAGIVILDSLHYPEMNENCTYGRYTDGTSRWFILPGMTPGASNVYSGIHNNDFNRQFIYPNPAENSFTVTFNEPLDSDAWIALYSSVGQELLKKRIVPGTSSEIIDISAFVKGLYFVTIADELSVYTEKLIKK